MELFLYCLSSSGWYICQENDPGWTQKKWSTWEIDESENFFVLFEHTLISYFNLKGTTISQGRSRPCYGDELLLLFKPKLPTVTDKFFLKNAFDVDLSKKFVKMLVNFSKVSNPTPNPRSKNESNVLKTANIAVLDSIGN